MKITKLHLLILFLICAIRGTGFYFKRVEKKEREAQIRQEQARVAAEAEEARKKQEEAAQAEAAAAAAAAEAEKKEAAPQKINYTIKKGDTLWSIAKRKEHFGAGHRWYDIWKANEQTLEDFDNLKAGRVIVIPLDIPKNYAWPATSAEKKARILKKAAQAAAAIEPPEPNEPEDNIEPSEEPELPGDHPSN